MFAVPDVTDAAGIGGGIDARAPAFFGGAAAGADVEIFGDGKSRGFLNADDVVFEAEIGIDIGLVLEVTDDDAGAVIEGEGMFGRDPLMREMTEDFPAKVLEIFDVGFAGFAQEKNFEIGEALAIIDADLSEHPMRFAAAASAAIADVLWAVIVVAETCGSAGAELGGLENDAGAGKVAGLVDGTTDAARDGQELIWLFFHIRGGIEERVRWTPAPQLPWASGVLMRLFRAAQ